MTLKSPQNLFRQGLEKLRWNGDLAFCRPELARCFALLGQGPNFSYRDVMLAQHNGFSRFDVLQIAGQVGLGLMDIQFNHAAEIRRKIA